MQLTSENTHSIFMECLFTDNEVEGGMPEHFIEAEGVMVHVGFHPGRIEEHTQDITDMLLQLPKEFMQSMGGGWTFLNACNDNQGNQWTGEQQTMDELVCLGLAIKKVQFQLPRSIWQALPGGMPYFSVLDK
jgi:hypothetical protein